eukprot:CAMPEP_0184353084 /NCGR_PEP_ID=MMETSP1089-20130417/74395_1 /TAXON_ID=38269 ORGANISM="Gloeochaete wittrockiana, Strain SAG46.84" /NCGR_SAMPLE_ID=MMETSP1089 /ASSEMBLY_ACC=CAM_ASM_000445 /LENGTH=58 /DNA_ID=CAMNT_0026688189 /DNA_START=56 /DNA_END=228 /DNA_ORIENTATION=+
MSIKDWVKKHPYLSTAIAVGAIGVGAYYTSNYLAEKKHEEEQKAIADRNRKRSEERRL